MDSNTEQILLSTVRKRFENETVVMIAHRLRTVADFDKVVVMKDGEAVEIGSPFSLLTRSPDDEMITSASLFAEMVREGVRVGERRRRARTGEDIRESKKREQL